MEASAAPAVKDRLTAVDTLALARELRAIAGAHVDKAFDLPGGGLSLVLRSAARGRAELVLVPGRYAALLEGPVEHAAELGPLARDLRRLLSGARLAEVRDPAGERQLELVLTRGDVAEPLVLVTEFFGTGNLLVVRGERIVAVASPRTWAHRAVRVGADYRRPPSRGNPFAASVAEIEAALAGSRTDRASTLAARLSLGGPVAEELLARSALPGNAPAASEPAASARALRSALDGLLSEMGDRPRAYLYRRSGVLVDVTPHASSRWRGEAGVDEETAASFSEGAHRFFSGLGAVAPPPSPAARARDELIRQLARQRAAVDALSEEVARRTRQGHAIYAHYAEAETAVENAKREGSAPDGVVETPLGEEVVPLRVDASLTASAQALYEEAKRAQAKLEGARTAAGQTEEKLRDLAETAAATPAPGTAAPRRERARLWFERFRWFLTSEGVLVVGGRDAASNDLIVRRYLRPRDLYLHADIHGAASVIVKHPTDARTEIGEASIREAAQWAVAFSKAWRAGLASADAFWVAADQVSKAGASGEFVARGAWVIHGTKNFLRDLPTELGLGTVEVQGEERWTVAPPASFRDPARLRFRLTPGEERERAAREVELSRDLGLSRTVLQSLLPAGGLSVRRA